MQYLATIALILALAAPLALAEPPLPPDLARRLDLARMLPPNIAGAAIVRHVKTAPITPRQKSELAYEAFLYATGFGVEPPPAYAVRQAAGPIAWLMQGRPEAMNPMGAALQAWKIYKDNYDPKVQPTLDFPRRRTASVEPCRIAFIDDPYDYYDAALNADFSIFANALSQARYAVDLGRVAATVADLPTNRRPLRELANLLAVQSTDRQFSYAMEFTPLHSSILRISSEAGRLQGKLLFQSYASFLDRHWRQKRCIGNDTVSFLGIVEEFNKAATQAEARWEGVSLPRLSLEASFARALDPDSYSERDEDIRDLLLIRLQIGGGSNDEVGFTSMLRAVEDFRPPSRLPAATRHLQKNFAFWEIFRIARQRPWELRAMDAWLRYIAQSRLQREAPQVWWAAVREVSSWIDKSSTRYYRAISAGDPALSAWLQLSALDAK